MTHLKSVDKGAFPLLSEGVTSLMGVIKWLNFTPKTTKMPGLQGALPPPGPHRGVVPDPLGVLKRPDPMPFEKKPHPEFLDPPLVRPPIGNGTTCVTDILQVFNGLP